MILSQNDQGTYLIPVLPYLPPVIIWNPFRQFPLFFGLAGVRMTCPTCNLPLHDGHWNTAYHASAQPRLIHDIDTVVMLIGITYIPMSEWPQDSLI